MTCWLLIPFAAIGLAVVVVCIYVAFAVVSEARR